MGSRTVKNYPSPRLMETIGATNQTAPEAIGELVANCFDARVPGTKMSIVVDMRDKKITVTDNGKGMTDAVLEKAVCIAEDMSRHIERGEDAKGHFGMGFKTSCSTLGTYYEIFTRPIEEDNEYHVAFDITDYSVRPSGADAWDVVIEYGKASNSGPLGDATHGTSFVVSKLKDKHITVSAVLEYLGEAFKGHLQMGDEIVVVDEMGKPHPPKPKKHDFIEGSYIEIDTSCGPDDAYRIKGWMALDKQTHNDGLYGFNIFRNKQLVETWDKSWFRAHLMTSRIIGEVNMDFLDATFYKQGLQQSEIWEIVQAHMKEYIRPLVRASQAASKQHNIDKPAEMKRIINTLRETLNEAPLPETPTSQKARQQKGGSKEQKASVHEAVKAVIRERSLIIPEEGEIEVAYTEKYDANNVRAPFDYIFQESDEEGEPSELQVIVFMEHPIWKKKADREVIKVLASGDAIYRVLVEKLERDTSEALKIRNDWVWARVTGEGSNS